VEILSKVAKYPNSKRLGRAGARRSCVASRRGPAAELVTNFPDLIVRGIFFGGVLGNRQFSESRVSKFAGANINFCYGELISNITSMASVWTTSQVLVGIVVPAMTLGLLGNCCKHVLVKRYICVLSARCPGEPRDLSLQRSHINFCYGELILKCGRNPVAQTVAEVLVGSVVPAMTLGLLSNVWKKSLAGTRYTLPGSGVSRNSLSDATLKTPVRSGGLTARAAPCTFLATGHTAGVRGTRQEPAGGRCGAGGSRAGSCGLRARGGANASGRCRSGRSTTRRGPCVVLPAL